MTSEDAIHERAFSPTWMVGFVCLPASSFAAKARGLVRANSGRGDTDSLSSCRKVSSLAPVLTVTVGAVITITLAINMIVIFAADATLTRDVVRRSFISEGRSSVCQPSRAYGWSVAVVCTARRHCMPDEANRTSGMRANSVKVKSL
jgi:hypothetical protein